MADQSTLTIGGIGGDPSGSHPIGNLNVNWTRSVDNHSIRFTANTIMPDLAAGTYHTGTTATYYSEVLCVGPLQEGMTFDIGDTGNAQLEACWQWYNPATAGDDADFSMSADGKTGTFGNGTWTNVTAAAKDYVANALTSHNTDDALALKRCNGMVRVALIATDADADGISHTIMNAGIAAVNAAYCIVADDHQVLYNEGIVSAYAGQNLSGSIGGIGADPS